MKICKKCNFNKEFKNFYKHKGYKDDLRPICIDCFKLEKSKYQKTNKNKNLYVNKYYNKYPEKRKQNSKIFRNNFKNKNGYSYTTHLYHINNFFKIKHNLRRRLRHSLKSKNWKKDTHFHEYIGCDKETLIKHIESKFQLGMTWKNYGDWHIDHIISLASANNEEELYKLCHYTNLQPLWALDNIKKSNFI